MRQATLMAQITPMPTAAAATGFVLGLFFAGFGEPSPFAPSTARADCGEWSQKSSSSSLRKSTQVKVWHCLPQQNKAILHPQPPRQQPWPEHRQVHDKTAMTRPITRRTTAPMQTSTPNVM